MDTYSLQRKQQEASSLELRDKGNKAVCNIIIVGFSPWFFPIGLLPLLTETDWGNILDPLSSIAKGSSSIHWWFLDGEYSYVSIIQSPVTIGGFIAKPTSNDTKLSSDPTNKHSAPWLNNLRPRNLLYGLHAGFHVLVHSLLLCSLWLYFIYGYLL